VQTGDLVMYKRSSEYQYRAAEPLGLIIKTWKPRFYPDHDVVRKFLIEWFIHPGKPTWYPPEELVLVSSAE